MVGKREGKPRKQWPLFLLAGILAIVRLPFSHAHAHYRLSVGKFLFTTNVCQGNGGIHARPNAWAAGGVVEWSIPYISSERTDGNDGFVAVQLSPNTTEDEVI